MLHGAMKTAVATHIIPINPTEGAVIPKKNNKPKIIFTQSELETFISEIEKEKLWHDFFYTAITTGLRRGEICSIRWEDFDEENGTLSVVRTVRFEKGELYLGDTKTGNGTRKIVLPQSTVTLLKNRKITSLSEWIFYNPLKPKEPMKPNSAYNKLKSILKKAALPNIRFHDIRHVFSTHALASGVDAKTLSNILGHANASFTLDTYTHFTSDMQRRASEIVGNFIEEVMV